MSFYFKIISTFNNYSIKIFTNTSNKNLKFQHEININREILHDEFDCGQIFVSDTNPLEENTVLTIFNPYSGGFLASTGKNIKINNYTGTTAGAITFLPESLLDKITFTPSTQNQKAYSIKIYKNNKITNNYLTHHIDTSKFYFLEIENTSRVVEEFDCDWYIDILNKNIIEI